MARSGVGFKPRLAGGGDPRGSERNTSVAGCRVEQVMLEPAAQFEYRWSGSSHYLALHSLTLSDGEAFCSDQQRSLRRNLRGALTFVPAGESVSGWSHLDRKPQSFLALYIDPKSLEESLQERIESVHMWPKLYFESRPLRQTLEKLNALFSVPEPVDPLYLQHSMSLGILELCQHFGAKDQLVRGTRLFRHQERQLIDFIDAHLHTEINLDNLAAITGHSRFHFLRLFKQTLGQTPYQFVLHWRIERAKDYLINGKSIESTFAAVGFKSKELFARAFKRITGITPHAFLRSRA